jgi:two-component system phosphate regulon sensor histidine kinase PhoR
VTRPAKRIDRFRRIVDAVHEAIVVFDATDLSVIDANRGALNVFGSSMAETIGRPVTDWMVGMEPSRLAAMVAPIVRGEVEARTLVLAYRRPDGGAVPMEILLQVAELENGATGVVAVARDIRDRIESQARLQRLAEAEHARAAELNAVISAMGEGIVVCAADGRVTLANPAASDLFPGVETRTYADILDQFNEGVERAPPLGTRAGPVELPTRSDPDRWLELATYPVLGPGVQADREETIIVMRDVTDARRREAIRETFVGVLSHELRTPVTTIYGGAKLLAREGSTLDEETRRGVFADITEESERLHRLVEDVVALNRFGDHTGDIGAEPVLLQRLLPRVVMSEQNRWPGVQFQTRIEPNLPTVVADPTYVEQVFRNLLSNAAKYGGAGTTIDVVAASEPDEVTVRILDDGPGFPAEESDRLFERFYRSQATARSASGAGIGLFVSARLIAAMGGRIWARPRPDGGSEFGFALQVLSD